MKNYITQKGKNKYTPFAGIKLISDLIDKLNIKEAIDSRFPLPNSNRGYNPYSYVKSIILGLLLGADCIMDIDNIKQDEVYFANHFSPKLQTKFPTFATQIPHFWIV